MASVVADGTVPFAEVTVTDVEHFVKDKSATILDANDDDTRKEYGVVPGAVLLASKNVPVYHYRFDYVATSAVTPQTKGAGHATDIPFFFDTAAIKYGAATSDTDRTAARTISRYLVNFVKTGDPNGPGLPAWGRVTATARPMLTLTRAGTAQVAPE